MSQGRHLFDPKALSAWLIGLLTLVIVFPAFAQGVVQQSGPVTAFHGASWLQNGIVTDAGTAAAPALDAMGLFDGADCPFGVSSQTSPGSSMSPFSQFTICQTDDTTTLTFAGLNGQPDPNVIFNVGGVDYAFPGSATANVTGPSTSIAGDLTCFNNTSGTLIIDCQNYSHANASALGGSEGILGVQASATVNITPAQIATYTTTSGTTLGPYTGEVAQPLPPGGTPACLNIFRYLTPAQQAAVQAGTSSQDFAPILTQAISDVTAPTSLNGWGAAGPCIQFPVGKFPFNSSIDLKKTVILQGTGGGGGLAGVPSATQLVFPANTTGIYIDQSNTLACTAAAGTTGAAGTVIRDLAIVSTSSTAGSAGDGIHMCVRAAIERVNVYGFPNNGIWVDGVAGFANEVKLDTVNLDSAVSDWGLYVKGANGNAGTFTAIGVLNSGGGGIYDGSFLGNTWTGAHVDTADALGLGWVTSGGHIYSLINMTVGIGASTTPGTNAAVWYDMGTGSGPPAWSGSGTYQVSAPIFADGANTRSVWTDPYVETGYPISSVSTPGIVIGGNLQTAFTTTTPFIFSVNGVGGFIASAVGMGGFQSLATGDVRGTYQFANARPDSVYIGNQIGLGFQMGDTQADVGQIHFRFNSFADAALMNGANTTNTYGRTAIVPYSTNINLLALGNSTNARVITNGTAIPSTTGDAVGEIVFNRTPAQGLPMGWAETVQGSPDTWVVLPIIPLAMGTTGTITGTALTATCDSGTATVTGATVGRPVSVSATDGVDVGGAFDLRASVTSTNTVTVYICGTGTPASKAYNVRVLQ